MEPADCLPLPSEKQTPEDIELSDILRLIEEDLLNFPGVIVPVDPALVRGLSELTAGVEIDLDSPLPLEEE